MILYRTNSYGKVVSIMVTNNTGESKLESVKPFHEIRRTVTSVSFQDQWNYWVLYMPFDGQFHDISHYQIHEEHMRQFYHRYHDCYNVINYKGKVILC